MIPDASAAPAGESPATYRLRNRPIRLNLRAISVFEHRSKPLLPRRQFYARMARSAAVALLVITVALGIGMVSYRAFEPMSWVDAFVNAAMILSGMGPVSSLQTDGGKIFAGCYALFSGLAFLTSLGIIFVPAFHRFLHKFHQEEAKRDQGKDKDPKFSS
jgi:hypothetical protein